MYTYFRIKTIFERVEFSALKVIVYVEIVDMLIIMFAFDYIYISIYKDFDVFGYMYK